MMSHRLRKKSKKHFGASFHFEIFPTKCGFEIVFEHEEISIWGYHCTLFYS